MSSMMEHRPLDDVHREELRIPIGSATVGATRFTNEALGPEKPSILMYVPYRKDDFITFGSYYPIIAYLARHDYNIVVADMVGSGTSTGLKAEPFEPQEGEEAAEIIKWLSDRTWSSPRIGMFGKSYGGITTLKAAVENPDNLHAIVPMFTPYSMYDVYEKGSLFFYLNAGYYPPFMNSMLSLPPSKRDSDGRWATLWRERLDLLHDSTPWLFHFLDHELKDDFWLSREFSAHDIEAATFAVGGYRDPYPQPTIEYFEAIDAPKKLLLGPWRHTIPHRGRQAALAFRKAVLDWFDHHLKGVDNGVDSQPDITYWTERNGGGNSAGCWRVGTRWPDINKHGSDPIEFALTNSGLKPLDSFDSGEFVWKYAPDLTVGVSSTDTGVFGGLTELDRPLITAEDDARSLTFESKPLDRPIELTGTATARLRVIHQETDPTLAVRLIDVDPTGTPTLVTRGILRASCRNSVTSPELLEPGEEYTIDIPLKPKSQIFERGHRLRVCLSAGLFPLSFPRGQSRPMRILSSHEAPAKVSFPGQIIESKSDIDNVIKLNSPEETSPVSSPYVRESSALFNTTRVPHSGLGRYETVRELHVDLPHANRLVLNERVQAQVLPNDPKTARIDNENQIRIQYDDEVVTTRTTSQVSRDYASIETTVDIDGYVIFDANWTRE